MIDWNQPTVACVYWRGKFRGRESIYDPSWVVKLRNMVARNLDIAHNFVCLTNGPTIDGVDTVGLFYNLPGWWAKLEAFSPTALHGRVLLLDLDLLVMRDLKPLLFHSGDFVVTDTLGPKNKNVPKDGHHVGVMAFDADCDLVGNIWKHFIDNKEDNMQNHRGDGRYLDQWTKHFQRFPKESITKLRYCPGSGARPDEKAIIIHSMPEKNHIAARKHAWIKEVWK